MSKKESTYYDLTEGQISAFHTIRQRIPKLDLYLITELAKKYAHLATDTTGMLEQEKSDDFVHLFVATYCVWYQDPTQTRLKRKKIEKLLGAQALDKSRQ